MYIAGYSYTHLVHFWVHSGTLINTYVHLRVLIGTLRSTCVRLRTLMHTYVPLRAHK